MAILMDATLIRAAPVPASMRLAGDANRGGAGTAAPGPAVAVSRGGRSQELRRGGGGPAAAADADALLDEMMDVPARGLAPGH
ncbi:MAG TPA: hypothetical protein VM264_00970 [Acidimicrobiales bacterium]|nr:hypothetical protein [Acidimicrobiales bacterium]